MSTAEIEDQERQQQPKVTKKERNLTYIAVLALAAASLLGYWLWQIW